MYMFTFLITRSSVAVKYISFAVLVYSATHAENNESVQLLRVDDLYLIDFVHIGCRAVYRPGSVDRNVDEWTRSKTFNIPYMFIADNGSVSIGENTRNTRINE